MTTLSNFRSVGTFTRYYKDRGNENKLRPSKLEWEALNASHIPVQLCYQSDRRKSKIGLEHIRRNTRDIPILNGLRIIPWKTEMRKLSYIEARII